MHVNILKGFHRGNEVSGIFQVHKPFKNNSITVVAEPNTFGNTVPTPRVQVLDGQYIYCNADGSDVDLSLVTNGSNTIAGQVKYAVKDSEPNYEQEFLSNESEQDAMDRIQHTFQMLETVADAAVRGTVKGLVVSGPPGIGKSHGVKEVLKRNSLFSNIQNNNDNYTIVTGASSAIGLYQTLYNYRKPNNTVMFDDCDSVLFDEVSLNLLKAALDSGGKRQICWNTESRVLGDLDIPRNFVFEGSVIFLTNINFENTKASKLQDHLKAIMSRCHYLDLEISNQRDLLLRVRQVVRDGMLDSYNITDEQKCEIVEYIVDNADYLREISLRMCTKIADIVKMEPTNWHEFVEATCLKRDAKFKRLRNAQIVSE